jgi:acylpyruvate hydrolase
MKLVTFERQGKRSIGALIGNQVAPLSSGLAAGGQSAGAVSEVEQAELPNDMLEFLAAGDSAMAAARLGVLFVQAQSRRSSTVTGPRGEPLLFPLDEVRLLAPIPRPGKLLCIGLNYRDHATEINMKVPDRPLLFSKFPNTVVGPGAPVVLPKISDQVDFEAELAVVIGKTAKGVTESDAMEYVAGYTIVNDVSARDLQMKLGGGQWVWGKTLDTFAPLGPTLVTRDEVPDPGSLNITFRLNGRTMQDSNTRNLIFGVPQLISFLSQGITLEPGDVIATGTPAGVGYNRTPPVYLKAGDVMSVEVERLGVLENPVIAES